MAMSDQTRTDGGAGPLTAHAGFRPADQLMIEFMNEHYEAARHHQTLRAETAALMTAAATFLFGQAFEQKSPYPVDYLGYALLAVGAISFVANGAFHRANRIHSETATACRKLLARKTGEPNSDPIWVRKAIVRAVKLKRSYDPTLEEVLKADEELKREAVEKAKLKAAAKEFQEPKKPLKIEDILSWMFDAVPFAILAAGILVIVRF